jgi:hypothetical protein
MIKPVNISSEIDSSPGEFERGEHDLCEFVSSLERFR